MRREGNLWERVFEPENLELAFSKALRGKRGKADAQEFAARREENLDRLAEELSAGTVVVGVGHQFTIYDPKQRLITAPCFRERVLHHAIMNVCEPVFERTLITDTFACRRGKGRIAALLRARQFAAGHACFLKLDVRKYFDSVSHDVLLGKLARLFKEVPLLELFRRIIEGYAPTPGRGLPIGSLTSQHFANFYLGELDRFVKQDLCVRGYARYMDDFALWEDASGRLTSCLAQVTDFLGDELQLTPKPPCYVQRTCQGMDWLGCRVYPSHMTLNRRSRRRFVRKLRAYEAMFAAGQMDERELQRRVESLVAFTRTQGVSSWQFRRSVLESRSRRADADLDP